MNPAEGDFAVMLKGHKMGVEDTIYALKHMLSHTHMLSDQKQLVFEMLNNLVVLPTRVYKEVVNGNLVR